MGRIDLTQGFAELGEEAGLRPYLDRLVALAGLVPQAVSELVSYEDLSEGEAKVLDSFAGGWSRSLKALSLKYLMSGRVAGQSGHLTVDRTGSGLPIWQEMVTLSQEKEASGEVLESMRSQEELKASMLRAMLRDQVSPAAQQYAMSQRLYQEEIADGDVVLPRGLLSFDRLEDAASGRRCYMAGWTVVDLQSNCPVVYAMRLEDSSGRTLDENDNRLPRLRAQIYGMSNLETGLLDMAIALDQSVDSLHPKSLRRFTFGPLLAPAFSAGSCEMLDLLRKAAPVSEEDWALRIRMETVTSRREFKSGGLFSSADTQEFTPNAVLRDGYLMTALPFQALCESRDDALHGVRKYVATSPGKVTAYS